MNIFEVSSECAGLAQRGGLGGVVWGISDAFIRAGHRVTLVMPFYEEIRDRVSNYSTLRVPYGGERVTTPVFITDHLGIRTFFIHSDRFFRGEYADVYIDSAKLNRGFFEDDAKRFAFFSAATTQLLLNIAAVEKIDTIHSHDWHTGLVLLLIQLHPELAGLAKTFRLFSVHNLEYQGTRPYAAWGELKGFLDWFPEFRNLPREQILPYLDPNTDIDCINPMRAAIRSADHVTTVSPNYAEEICRSDNPAEGFFGGRGLERDFEALRSIGRLTGITNGIDLDFYNPADLPNSYSQHDRTSGKERNRAALWQEFPQLLKTLHQRGALTEESIAKSLAVLANITAEDFLAKPLLVAVTRMTEQKIRQFFEIVADKSVVTHLKSTAAYYIFLGKGNLSPQFGQTLSGANNMIFLNGFDDNLEKRLYASADAMLMPSDFEPCGTSQMKAMRYGCIPVAARVGGLVNTIQDGHNGFLYGGATRSEKVAAFLKTIQHVIDLYYSKPERLLQMQVNAMATDFSWDGAAATYLQLMRRS